MNVLFLDQSGHLGGAELCLADIAQPYRQQGLVALLADGPFKAYLEQRHIPVQVLTQQSIQVRKESSWVQGLKSLRQILPLIQQVAQISRDYDVIYANTQKALVIAALASSLSRCPLVYHLHDIVSPEHFSATNRRLIVTLANRFASRVIANSEASQAAFVEAGGRPELTTVIYNGFEVDAYRQYRQERDRLRQDLGLSDRFVVGHFSRLSPWKGQHILIEALTHCPEPMTVLLVGDALFGEADYAQHLRQQVIQLGLEDRVQFLGFRSDVGPLMAACDLVAHTSTAPEPFGRVIVEAMLCGTPVVAASAGGATELVNPGQTGWLAEPGNVSSLVTCLMAAYQQPQQAQAIAQTAQQQAQDRFNLERINQQIAATLSSLSWPQAA